MEGNTIVIDIETAELLGEIGSRNPENLTATAIVTLDVEADNMVRYTVESAGILEGVLREAGLVVGFNLYGFDYKVLQKYMRSLNLADLPTLDMMRDVQRLIGKRVSLNQLAYGCLGHGKSASGIDAVKWWREGEFEKVFKYCEDDVRVTNDVYQFGCTTGTVYLDNRGTPMVIRVDWGSK